MKITQEKLFKPITIVLETQEEAIALTSAVSNYSFNLNETPSLRKICQLICVELRNREGIEI